jgi:hypothetical protein
VSTTSQTRDQAEPSGRYPGEPAGSGGVWGGSSSSTTGSWWRSGVVHGTRLGSTRTHRGRRGSGRQQFVQLGRCPGTTAETTGTIRWLFPSSPAGGPTSDESHRHGCSAPSSGQPKPLRPPACRGSSKRPWSRCAESGFGRPVSVWSAARAVWVCRTAREVPRSGVVI